MVKYYLYIILTLIFFALSGIGFLLYKSFELNKIALKDNLNKMLDETSDKIFISETSDTVFVESNGEKEPKGTVSGKICYASESIPPLTIYFENVESGEVYALETGLNQSDYTIDLSPGTYISYAYVQGIDETPGGYTEAVTCGLTADCEDHTLIQFDVEDDELTADIDVCDWYGAEVPDQPSESIITNL